MSNILISCIPYLNLEDQKAFRDLIIALENLGHSCVFWGSTCSQLLLEWYLPFQASWDDHSNNSDFFKIYSDGFELEKLHFEHNKWLGRARYWVGYDRDKESIKLIHKKHFLYSLNVINKVNPDVFLCWNPMAYMFGVAYDIAKSLAVAVGSIEWGYLSGTIMIDTKGIGNLSILSQKSLEDCIGNETDKFLSIGKKYRDFVQDEELSIYQQPETDVLFEQLLQKGREIAPKVVCLGLADCDTGVIPHEHGDRLISLPHYHSSFEMALSVAKVNSGITIFKPHPIDSHRSPQCIEELNFYEVNIDPITLIKWADVVVIICSKLEFSTMLLEKPLILINNGFLLNKSCAYEVHNPQQLKQAINDAYDRRDYQNKMVAFDMFLGYVICKYLYNLRQNKSVAQYFRSAKEVALDIQEMFNLTEINNNKLKNLDGVVAISQFRIRESNQEIHKLNAQVAELNAQVAELNAQVVGMKRSIFWKLRNKWFDFKLFLGLTTEKQSSSIKP